MRKVWLAIILAGICLVGTPVHAVDSLAAWAASLDKPETQQLILGRIFSGEVGPLSAGIPDKQTGSYLFPKNNSWVRLAKEAVYVSSTSTGGPYLVVSCMLYNRLDQEPVSATSYIFYDPAQRPTAISGGYANYEQIQLANLPKLNRWFLVMVDTSGKGSSKQSSAFVLAFEGTDRPRTVWNSPMSAWTFQFGFTPLTAQEEELILRTTKHGEIHYSAYHWNGDRFDPDGFASESRLKALPESVWRYGSAL
jgi:hypothetical protein